MLAIAASDPSHCPLCGEPNRCAMQTERSTGVKQPACWCTQMTFAQALLERIPLQARRPTCICQACATVKKETSE